MNSMPELVKLVRFAVARTDRTVRLCAILLCAILLCAGPVGGVVLYVAFALLPEVTRP